MVIEIPETKTKARSRARKLGFPQSSITKATSGSAKGKYFLSPRGIKKAGAKRTYANLRSSGASKEKAARIAWSVQQKK